MSSGCHGSGGGTLVRAAPHIALVGAPNAGKTSVFNALTGLRGRTGNYPGVTVSRFVGTCRVGVERYVIEDLPGTYGLRPVSPDEQIVTDVLDGRLDGVERPDALLVVADATTLRRSLGFGAQILAHNPRLPACLVVTFTDELLRRQGALDVDALAEALGVPVLAVVGHRRQGVTQLRDLLAGWRAWPAPVLPPPVDGPERDAWVESVLGFAGYRAAERHRTTQRIDAVLLHPLWGTLVFFAVMPPYRLPSARSVAITVWSSAKSFVYKCTTIIVATTIGLWLLLNLPLHSAGQLQAAGVDPGDRTAVAAYSIDHSYAAGLGRLMAPVFDPLGFDWRINVGVLSAQAARETFVATLGQVGSANDPEDPAEALCSMTYTDGPRAGQRVFTAPTTAALLVYFAFAMQCMATIGVIRRETGTWTWPLVAFGYLTVSAWLLAYLARMLTGLLTG